MDYKKVYDNALEKAKSLIEGEETNVPVFYVDNIKDLFPELKESEDERIRKELICFLNTEIPQCEARDKYIAWLEKQAEQKPADKVEPKFHEGEWITNGDYTWQIVNATDLDYILQSQNGHIVYDTISHVDEQFHSFTIEDAKDGDVLVAPTVKGSEHPEQIFIFKEIKDRDYVKNAVEYYCRCIDNGFISNERGFMGQSNDYFTPATKEQRDLLFQKMHEAGYMWDSESKQLLSLKAEPNKPQRMISAEAKEAMYSKPAWSEEDEIKINRIVACLENLNVADNDILLKDVDWLKSLRPQNRWKPSKEQMEVLERISKMYNYIELESLYNELKKL